MNAIIGMISIAKKSKDADEMQECLEKIDDSANHLLGVINDVLDMSKIEAGKMELSETDFRFQDMITQVATVMNYKMDEKHQNFLIRIMDVNMPEIDGYEATRMIRGMKIAKAQTVPIIAMTANVFREDIEKCILAGMNDHVGKPLDMDTVIAKMERYLL